MRIDARRTLVVVVAIAVLATLLVPGVTAPAGAATNEPDLTLGTGFGGYGRGFPGSLQFRHPGSVSADANGDLYVVERSLGRIRHVSAEGENLATWGAVGSGPGQFNQPQDIAVAPDGTVYVADTLNYRVQRFEADGGFLSMWGSNGNAAGQFNRPKGVAVGADGTVYVADDVNDRVQAFTSAGAFITSWGPGTGDTRINDPSDVAVAPDGTVLLTNHATGAGHVQRYSSTGSFLDQWVATGTSTGIDVGADGRVYVARAESLAILDANLDFVSTHGLAPSFPIEPGMIAPGLLVSPQDVTVDADGVVTVADSRIAQTSTIARSDTLNRFDSDGGFLARLGSADNQAVGPTEPQFVDVADVAVAPSGDQYVVEVGNNRVQRLTATGTYVSHWGGPYAGTGPGQFDAPESVAVDASGDVFVADTGNDRVQRFGATGTFEAQFGSSGSGHGQFDGPSGIAVDPATGDLFVADSGNDRVQRFSSSGVFEAAWGASRLDDPGDLVVGSGPSVYVVDTGHKRVVRFSRAGGVLLTFETIEIPSLTGARFQGAVAVDERGNVYVSRILDDVAKYSRSGALVRTFVNGDVGGKALAVNAAGDLVSYLTDEGFVHQTPTGPFLAVRAAYDDPSGAVGRLLHAKVAVVNSGTTTLTGVALVDPGAPGCAGPVPDLPPGEEHITECTVVPSAPGTHSHTATVDTDQTAPLTSETATVDVAMATGPALVDEWGVLGEGSGELDDPRSLAVDATGDVFVANRGNHVVSRFDTAGAFEVDIPANDVRDIDVDSVGDLVRVERIGQTDLQRLVKSDRDGTQQWSRDDYTSGVSFGQDDRLWQKRPFQQQCDECPVVSNSSVKVRSGSTGDEQGSFAAPDAGSDPAVHDATDRVYTIGVFSSPSVRAFTRSGVSLGVVAGTVQAIDVDVDAAGLLYVAIDPVTGPDVVKVLSPSGTLLARWETPADALTVAPDGTVYVLDADAGRVRRFGFPLSGQVTESGSGDPVPGAWVHTIDTSTGALMGITADSDGSFFATVGLGDRWVGFLDPSGGHTGEWFDDTPLTDLPDADEVTIVADAPNIANAALEPAGRTAAVAGTVTSSSGGAPLPGVFVGVVDLSDGNLVAGAVSDGGGTYEVGGLGGGAHLVVFIDPSGAHQGEFFDDSTVPSGSTVLPLEPGQTSTADAALAVTSPAGTGAGIEGTVTGDGDPLEGALVVALDAADFSFVRGGFTDSAGEYHLDLPPGSYRVEFVDPSGGHAGEWHEDHPLTDLGGSTPVLAPAGPAVTVHADLDPSGHTGSIAGTVTGPGNEAVDGSWAVVLDAATFTLVGGATVNADGEYLVEGLAAGDYFVTFIDPSDVLSMEWNVDAPDVGTATPVPVVAGQRSEVNAALAP